MYTLSWSLIVCHFYRECVLQCLPFFGSKWPLLKKLAHSSSYLYLDRNQKKSSENSSTRNILAKQLLIELRKRKKHNKSHCWLLKVLGDSFAICLQDKVVHTTYHLWSQDPGNHPYIEECLSCIYKKSMDKSPGSFRNNPGWIGLLFSYRMKKCGHHQRFIANQVNMTAWVFCFCIT